MNWLDLLDIQYKRKGNRPLGVHNIPLIDKRNKKDVDAFNKKYKPHGIKLIPDKKGEGGQQQWKVSEGTSEDTAHEAQKTAVASNEKGLVGNYGGINFNNDPMEAIFSDKGKVPDKGVSTANAAAKKQWLLDTANSPAATAGIDPDERWRLNQAHQAFKARRSGAKTSTQEQSNEATAGAFSPQFIPVGSDRDSLRYSASPFNPANKADHANAFTVPSESLLNLPDVKQYQKLANLPTNAFTNANMNTAAAEGAGFMGFKDAEAAASKLGAFSKSLELFNKMTAKDPEPNVNVSKNVLDPLDFSAYIPQWY